MMPVSISNRKRSSNQVACILTLPQRIVVLFGPGLQLGLFAAYVCL